MRSSSFLIYSLLTTVTATLSATGFAQAAPNPCFDFSAKVLQPLRTPQQRAPASSDLAGHGEKGGGIGWAEVRGKVDKPILDLYQKLLDHRNFMNPRINELSVSDVTSPHYLARHLVKYLVKPFLFVRVTWNEDWAYALEEGTPADPKSILISYQKTEGTDHIGHLCGNILLRKLDPSSTDVFQYEEVKATQRTAVDTQGGLLGNLKKLRGQ